MNCQSLGSKGEFQVPFFPPRTPIIPRWVTQIKASSRRWDTVHASTPHHTQTHTHAHIMFSARTAAQISNYGDVPENRKSHSSSTKRLSKFEFQVGLSYITAELTLSVCGETGQQIPERLTNKWLVGDAVLYEPEVRREDTSVISAICTWCICSCLVVYEAEKTWLCRCKK